MLFTRFFPEAFERLRAFPVSFEGRYLEDVRKREKDITDGHIVTGNETQCMQSKLISDSSRPSPTTNLEKEEGRKENEDDYKRKMKYAMNRIENEDEYKWTYKLKRERSQSGCIGWIHPYILDVSLMVE